MRQKSQKSPKSPGGQRSRGKLSGMRPSKEDGESKNREKERAEDGGGRGVMPIFRGSINYISGTLLQ